MLAELVMLIRSRAVALITELALNKSPRYTAGIRQVSGATMSTVIADIKAKIRLLTK